MRFSFVTALCLGLLLNAPLSLAQQTPPGPVAANEPASPELPPSKPLQVPQRPGITAETSLGLTDVISMVLENDRDLLVSRIAAAESLFNVKGAKGYYDPVFGLNAYRLRSVTPVASLIGGAANGKLTQKELYADGNVSGNIPFFGESYKLDFSSARQSTDSTFVILNPQFPSAATLNLTQPLWRGLRFDENRYRLQVARKNVQLTDNQLRQRAIEIVTQAIQAYWELEFAYRNLEVQIEAVRLAEQQDDSNRRQVRQGVLAPVDVIQTQTQIATFQQNVFTAQESLTRAENGLKTLILPSRMDALWSTALTPVTPPGLTTALPDMESAVKDALANRPELAESKINLEVNKLENRLNTEQARPQINAVATLSVQGLAGRPVPVVPNPILTELGFPSSALPAIFPGGYSQSLQNLYNGSFPTAQVGVQMSLPIRNRTAAAQLAISRAESKRLLAQQQLAEMTVQADVRNALQSLAAARDRLQAAESARESAEAQYASEQRQFQAGASSVFLVLQRQTDLIAARSREIRANADAGRAAADLDRATAHTLAAHNIELQTPTAKAN